MKRPRTSPAKDKAVKAPGNQSLRIIGGQWRGRKLNIVSADGLRPTGDRIRETLFNWLMPELPGAHCLDAYSGSGALGLEALSRGASSAVLIELDRHAAQRIRDNLTLLKCDLAQVEQADCLSWLANKPSKPFDVVFLDPPFQQNLWADTIALLDQPGWLSEGAAIYIETPRDLSLNTPTAWQLHREKHAGGISYRLYYRQ